MFETHDPESNNAQASRSQDQSQLRPKHSASIHSHPRMMCGLQRRLSQIKGELVSDHARGILAVQEVIATLHDLGKEPFPGFAENMIAEFATIREELGALDPNQPNNAQQFVAVGKRLDFLSRTLSFVVGYWLPTAEINTSAACPSDSDTDP